MVWVQGNDHTVANNDLHDGCQEGLDSGAVYSGREWTYRGNQFVGNRVSNINSHAGTDVTGIYLDDLMSGWIIHNNTFINNSRAFLLGGGRDNSFMNNQIVASGAAGAAVHFDDRGEGWAAGGCKPGGLPYDFLARVPYATSPAWKKYGPTLANITTDSPCVPKYNKIENNCYSHLAGSFLDQSAGTIASWKSVDDHNAPCSSVLL